MYISNPVLKKQILKREYFVFCSSFHLDTVYISHEGILLISAAISHFHEKPDIFLLPQHKLGSMLHETYKSTKGAYEIFRDCNLRILPLLFFLSFISRRIDWKFLSHLPMPWQAELRSTCVDGRQQVSCGIVEVAQTWPKHQPALFFLEKKKDER